MGGDRVIRGGGFEFLGAPIGTPEFCEQHAKERVRKAKKILVFIADLPDSQIGLRLMRTRASFCRCPDHRLHRTPAKLCRRLLAMRTLPL